jgi:hypothetical protein
VKRLSRLLIVSFVLSLLIAVPILFSISITILAQGEITVISSDTEMQFPSTITFSLEVEAASDIADIDLVYRKSGESLIPVSSRVDVDFIPGQLVAASWIWDMLETGGLPPGTEIDYWWLIEDAAGHELQTSPVTIAFDDLSHDWQSLASDHVTIFWYEGDLSFVQDIVDAADEALERLAGEIEATLAQPVKIYIYASSEDLLNALIYPQEWTGGLAFPGYGTVIIGISPDNLAWGKRAIAHEMGHLVVHQALTGFYGHLPVWLDEGLAMDAEGDLRSDLQTLLNEAIAHDTLYSVRSISSSFPTDPDEARLCYAESYSLVQFLIGTYGSDKILKLMAVLDEGNTYDDAMLEVYDFNVDGLNTVWRESLSLGPQPSPIPDSEASGFPAPYIALVAIVVILSVVPIYLALSFRRRIQ